MRYAILVMAVLLGSAASSQTQAQTRLSLSIGSPGAHVGFVMSDYPTLVRIPGYPVYYDPRLDSNYFFYDGLYWVLQGDDWYSSTWYDGPWDWVSPAYVPLFVLRIPVRYYRRPPAYFRGWHADRAPRWGEHWGRGWERQRDGWDRWDRRFVPRAAPLPSYQRHYSGSRYPHHLEQQRSIASRSYDYRPRDSASREVLDLRHQRAEQRGRQQQPYRDRQPQDVHQQQRERQQQQRVQQQRQLEDRQQHVQQQQLRNERQQQVIQQQQQQRDRQQQDIRQQANARERQVFQQQRQRNERQQQDIQLQQLRRHARQQQETRQYQEQKGRPQQRSQPEQNARGNSDNKGAKRGSDKYKHQKDHQG